jgi:hypothetical protein
MLDPVVRRYCPDSPWTNAIVDELKLHVAAGLSASQIAAALPCEISRNAVIGKISRMGLDFSKRRTGEFKPKEPKPRIRIRKPQTAPERSQHWWKATEPKVDVPLPDIPEVVLEPRNIALADLEPHHCRYPVETDPFLFCGHQRDGDEPYCPAHCRLCFQIPRR